MHSNARPLSSLFSHTRRGWSVLLALGALVLLAACGGTSGPVSTPTAATGATPTATATIGGTTPTATTPAGNGHAVTITTDSSGNFAFSPATLTVKVGTTVTWTNMTQAPHTVTSDDGKSFDSGIATPIPASGGTFSFTFKQAGTFGYHCQIHPFMKATIIVTA